MLAMLEMWVTGSNRSNRPDERDNSASRPPRSRRASKTTPSNPNSLDDVTTKPAPKGPELPEGQRLKKIELKGCSGIFEMLNCTLTVEPVSKMNGCPIFVGVATGPAIAGNDADAMEDFAVYCYKGKGDGAWRFTFDPQDMPKDRCCLKSEETEAKLPIDLTYMSTDGTEWYSDRAVCVHAVIELRRRASGRRADGSFKEKEPGPNNV